MRTPHQLLAFSLLRLLCLAGAPFLSSCTPSADTRVYWQVANQTADTLVVTTQFALDSITLPLDAVKRWAREDSIHGGHAPAMALHRVVQHQGQWYLVEAANYTGIDTYIYGDPNNPTITQAQVDVMHGRVTYRIPPGKTQRLVNDGSTRRTAREGRPPFTGLYLQQGRMHRTLPLGLMMKKAFQQLETGYENANNSLYLYQLTIGPGLVVKKIDTDTFHLF